MIEQMIIPHTLVGRRDNADLDHRRVELLQELFALKTDFDEFAQDVAADDLSILRQQHEQAVTECRALLNHVRQAEKALASAESQSWTLGSVLSRAMADMKQVRSEMPRASTYPSKHEVAEWETRLSTIEQRVREADGKVQSNQREVAMAENGVQSAKRELANPAAREVGLRRKIAAAEGKQFEPESAESSGAFGLSLRT